MSGDRTNKSRYGLRNYPDPEMKEDTPANEVELTAEQHGDRSISMDMIREAMKDAMTSFHTEIKKDLENFRSEICEEMKKQTGELATEMSQKLHDTNIRVSAVEERIQQVEDSMAESERWDIGVKNTLIQLLQSQRALQDKVSDLEGRARRNNIRLYGVPEGSEGTSLVAFIDNLIKSELGGDAPMDRNFGIEGAHRALGPKPPASAPPRSIIVRFLSFSIKETILHAAWKKTVRIQVYFDHDYALEVQKRRKEYIPIKRALKEKGIRFQTPLTKMRVFYTSGSVLYDSAIQAAEDLRKRGMDVDRVPVTARSNLTTEETLVQLLPWETQTTRRAGFQESIREKLKVFRREGNETE
ncbi:unnamed protein product [Knipowitschia caucasica]|uniref:L1 transposable element RRM domain-containing protein n=1 Tax=Knipowitschia caucasica TaxID=637954 RepID=A0AAV2J9P8_KNICA